MFVQRIYQCQLTRRSRQYQGHWAPHPVPTVGKLFSLFPGAVASITVLVCSNTEKLSETERSILCYHRCFLLILVFSNSTGESHAEFHYLSIMTTKITHSPLLLRQSTQNAGTTVWSFPGDKVENRRRVEIWQWWKQCTPKCSPFIIVIFNMIKEFRVNEMFLLFSLGDFLGCSFNPVSSQSSTVRVMTFLL